MGLGYVGRANLVDETETTATYSYGAQNLNDQTQVEKIPPQDGHITISKSSLVVAEHRIKRRKTAKGRITYTKIIPRDIHAAIANGLESGQITITPSVNEFQNQRFAIHILIDIFNNYQTNEKLPELAAFMQ